jgi:hypothetical protein
LVALWHVNGSIRPLLLTADITVGYVFKKVALTSVPSPFHTQLPTSFGCATGRTAITCSQTLFLFGIIHLTRLLTESQIKEVNSSFLGFTDQLRPWPPPQNPAEFLEGFSTILFLYGRVVSPTPNPHPEGPGLCIYIPQRQVSSTKIRICIECLVLGNLKVFHKNNPLQSWNRIRSFLDRRAVQCCDWIPPFRRDVLPPSRFLFEETFTVSMRVYPKLSGLASWSEKCKLYSSLPLGAVVSLFCESV